MGLYNYCPNNIDVETILMNMENSKTNEPHKFVLNLSQRLDLRSSNKHVALQNLSIYYTWKNLRKLYKNNKLKIIAPTGNDEFELPDGFYSVSIPPVHIYINRIYTTLVFKIKDGYKLELQTPETMKLFGSTEKLIDKTENGEKVQSLEVVEVVLVQCNLVDSQYQEKTEVLYTFTPNKSYAYLLSVEPSNLVFLETYNTESDEIIITFTDQNGRPLDIEGKVNLTLLINK